jgi:fructose-1-phosphate kinase PfkB-like protein
MAMYRDIIKSKVLPRHHYIQVNNHRSNITLVDTNREQDTQLKNKSPDLIKAKVQAMKARYEQGKDLWTGEILEFEGRS